LLFSISITGLSIELKVGYYDNPPLCYEKNGQAAGIFPELLSNIARKENWNLKYEKFVFAEGLEKIYSGQLDAFMVVAEIPQRAERATFNRETVLYNWGEIYVRNSSNIRDIGDLENKTIAVIKDDVYFLAFKEISTNFDLKVEFIEVEGDYPQLMEMMYSKQADACIVSRIFGQMYTEKYNLKNLEIVISPVKLKFIFRKDIDRDIVDTIDSYLESWKNNKNSPYYSTIDKYFGTGVVKLNRLFLYSLISAAVVAFVLLLFTIVLKKLVNIRTQELANEKEALTAANQELLAITEELETTQSELDKTIEKLEKLIELIAQMGKKDLPEEEFLRNLLYFAVDNVSEADTGSIWIVEDEHWKLVAAVGHDEELFKKLELDKKYMYPAKDVEIVDIEKYDEIVLPQDIKEVFDKAAKPIKISMIAPMFVNDECIGHFTLDIDKNSPKNFTEPSKKFMKSLSTLASAFIAIKHMTKLQGKFHKELVLSLVRILELRDPYTRGHSERVANLANKLAERINLSKEEIKTIYWAGLVHDIGKVLIDDTILNKPEKLTEEERKEVEKHPVHGARILGTMKGMEEISKIVRYHHERWDGKGYPEGLKGDEIPLGARILALADSFDAMTSDRPYRAALSLEDTLKELKRCSGSQFDPELVDVFIDIVIEESNFSKSEN
jgi:putative nucleotidyltransferase with HDIG domain